MKNIAIDINGTPHEIKKGVKPDFKIFARWFGDRYLVLASGDGDLFNPMNYNHLSTINKKDRERGKMLWELRSCSQECYSQYTLFLRSKNRTPYLLAQRRFRNGL